MKHKCWYKDNIISWIYLDTIAGLSTGGDGNPIVDETKYEVANVPCIIDCEEAKHHHLYKAELTQAKLRVSV